MRMLALTCLVACTRSSHTTPRDDARTPLHVVVLDDYSARESCDGIVPRTLEVLVDGAPAGRVEIPCRTKTIMPPPQVQGPTLSITSGTHVIVARERGLGNSVEQTLELPVYVTNSEDGTDVLADKLPVWASDDQLQITAPKVTISFDSSE